VRFSGPALFDVVNIDTGVTVISGGAYSPGGTISFDGLDVVITGSPATDDVFEVSAHEGAAQGFGVALTDTDKIATASTALSLPGDNTNALALIGLHTARQGTLGNVTFNDYQAQTVGDVGIATQQAESRLQSTTLEFEQLSSLRESISGVSLDEELTNLLSFQRSFEASARMLTVADELFQTLLALGR